MINKSNSDRNILGVENIGSLICKMSIPIMFSMMVMALYNVVDSIFISHYGLKNEPKYLFITGKGVCVFLVGNADSFVISISPKVEPSVV